MPTVPTIANSVALADRRLLRAYPRIVKELTDTEEQMGRNELDGFLKLLPGAVERFEENTAGNANAIDPSILSAILSLTSSFGPRNVDAVNIDQLGANSNTASASVEMESGVSDPELPNGSDTSQQAASNALPHSELEAPAGNGGESGSLQADLHNPRVSTASRLQGRRARGRARRATGETADDRG